MKNDFSRIPRTEITVVSDNGIGKISPQKRDALTILGKSTEGVMLQEADFVKLTELCRTMLTQDALQHIAALSNLEETLSMIAPKGTERYKALLDAFTIASAKVILRW